MPAAQNNGVHLVPLTEALALNLPNSAEIHDAAFNAATEGGIISTKDMSCLDQVFYPTPGQRALCSCFFTTCCLASTGGIIIGCEITTIGGLISSTPPVMKTIFAFPALVGWIGSCIASIPLVVHYRYGIKQRRLEEQPIVVQGIPLPAHPSNTTLFQRATASSTELVIRTETETNPVVAANITVRPPPGYQPPEMN